MRRSEMFRELYGIAEKYMNREGKRRTEMRVLGDGIFPQEFYQLACRARGVESMPDEEVLSEFYEDPQLIKSLPNLFWACWVTLLAIPQSLEQGVIVPYKIPSESLTMVIEGRAAALRDTMRIREFPQELEQFSGDQKGLGVSWGIVLVSPDQEGLVLNPILKFKRPPAVVAKSEPAARVN